MNRHRFVLGTLVLMIIAAAALLTACGGSKSNPMAPVAGADVTITIVGSSDPNSYSPRSASCTAGQKVAWRNSGGTTHTATADHGAFDTGDIANGSTSAPITMGTAGVYTYHCLIHGFAMTGTLTVTGP